MINWCVINYVVSTHEIMYLHNICYIYTTNTVYVCINSFDTEVPCADWRRKDALKRPVRKDAETLVSVGRSVSPGQKMVK